MDERLVTIVDNGLQADDFVRLRVETGFQSTPLKQAEKALRNGLFNIAAICEGQVVGMGRLVGDGAMYWYLQEIIVLPEFQGKGIGKRIVGRLLDYIEETAIPGTKVTVGLSAVKRKEAFYEKFGFFQRPTEFSGPGMAKWFEIGGTDDKCLTVETCSGQNIEAGKSYAGSREV